jgi:uncharacterized protein (TIGR02444 family)
MDQDVTDVTGAAPAENPFWDYSVEVYGRDGVKDACLALQDETGADVNLILFFCWFAQSGRGRLVRAEVQSAMAAVAVWRVQVLLPMRRVRSRLRANDASDEAALRKDLLKLELQAERIEQDRLFKGVSRDRVPLETTPESRRADAEYNCSVYLDELGVELNDGLEQALKGLIDTATLD